MKNKTKFLADSEVRKLSSKYTLRQWTVFATVCCIKFCAGLTYSFQAPFFPKLSQEKGVPSSIYGFVLGINQITLFIVSPIYGKNIQVIGRKFLLLAGTFSMGICTILFGLLDKCPGGMIFTVLAIAIAIGDALGRAAYRVAVFVTVTFEFTEDVAAAYSTIETFYGVGQVVGPTIGGTLFEVGSYICPFASAGAVFLLTSILVFFYLPSLDKVTNLPGSFVKLIRFPGILIAYYTVASVSFSQGFNIALLEPHCRQFNLTPTKFGLIFLIEGGTYVCFASLWGCLLGKRVGMHPKVLSSIGGLIVAIGFTLIGPAPFIPVQPLLWLTTIALTLHGTGIAGEFISTLIDIRQEAIFHGYPDTVETSGLVSGIWYSGYALGGILGPVVSGIFNDVMGFRNTSLVVIAIHIFVAIFNYTFYALKRKKRVEETITEDIRLLGGAIRTVNERDLK